jgi:protein-tyrosine phosphatase
MPDQPLIITVCTANICRSPMAEALLRHALAAQPEPWKSLRVISAGVAAVKGEPVSENSRVALKKAGIDIGNHSAQPLTREMVKRATLILCMTESHRAQILHAFNASPTGVRLFREFMPGDGDREIGDPFGGPLRLYESARDEMVEAIPSLVEYIKNIPAPKAS